MPSRSPAFVIAATHSGAGKTTVTSIVLRELCRRGLAVQPFKIGPDFIDPAYHREITGRCSINLDAWMMGVDGVRRSFDRWSCDADIRVIEAMGALYDGMNGTEKGSAAHIAKVLGIPVIVVLDAWGMTRTTGAIVDGLCAFDPGLRLAGCVLNRVGGRTHTTMITEAMPQRLKNLILGAVEHQDALATPERHLGLVTVEENETSIEQRAQAQTSAGQRLDIDHLLRVTTTGTTGPRPPGKTRSGTFGQARIAVARDAAFCFYYEENLLAMRDAGFELTWFSPTLDDRLPEGVDAVYLGGGYPESFAPQLEGNQALAKEIKERGKNGTPIYAECGGMIYLARSLTGFDGVRRNMAGLLPLDIAMDRTYLSIRYVEARIRHDSPLGTRGSSIRGQEFHQSRIVEADLQPTLYDVTASDGETYIAGYLQKNIMASYIHLHFAERPDVLKRLLGAAVRYRAHSG